MVVHGPNPPVDTVIVVSLRQFNGTAKGESIWPLWDNEIRPSQDPTGDWHAQWQFVPATEGVAGKDPYGV